MTKLDPRILHLIHGARAYGIITAALAGETIHRGEGGCDTYVSVDVTWAQIASHGSHYPAETAAAQQLRAERRTAWAQLKSFHGYMSDDERAATHAHNAAIYAQCRELGRRADAIVAGILTVDVPEQLALF